MNAKTSLVLMLLFLVLGTFAFFDPLRTKEKAELRKDQESHVFWLKDKLLESLTIRAGQEEIALRCAREAGCPFDPSGDWRMQKPVSDLADPANVGAAAGSVMNLTRTDRIALEGGVDPKEFGFDPPEVELELRVKGEAEPYGLKVGTARLLGGAGAYVLTNRDPRNVYVVGSFFPGMFRKDAFHWRNKRLFPEATGEQIQALEWSSEAGPRISAVREGAGWKLESPGKAPANNMMLAGLASTVAYLEMKAEEPPTPAARKILARKPEWQIAFRDKKDGWERVSLFAAPAEPRQPKEYVARKPGDERLFRIDGAAIERFRKPLIEYRDRRLLTGDELSAATEIALRFPREKKQIVLKPDRQGWAHAGGDQPGEALSRERIDAFFRALSAAEADKFLPGGADPAAAFFAGRPADLEVELRVNGQVKRKLRFTVHSRREVLTESPVPGELASLGGRFLQLLPVRFVDLYESNNKQVVTSETKAEEHGEHSHSEHGH